MSTVEFRRLLLGMTFLALTVLAGSGCRLLRKSGAPANPDLIPPPPLPQALGPVAAANRIMTSLLVYSPLFQRGRTVRLIFPSTARQVKQSLQRKFAAESREVVSGRAAADWLLQASIDAGSGALCLVLKDRKGVVRWRFRESGWRKPLSHSVGQWQPVDTGPGKK